MKINPQYHWHPAWVILSQTGKIVFALVSFFQASAVAWWKDSHWLPLQTQPHTLSVVRSRYRSSLTLLPCCDCVACLFCAEKARSCFPFLIHLFSYFHYTSLKNHTHFIYVIYIAYNSVVNALTMCNFLQIGQCTDSKREVDEGLHWLNVWLSSKSADGQASVSSWPNGNQNNIDSHGGNMHSSPWSLLQ